jgi:hypothetical protein
VAAGGCATTVYGFRPGDDRVVVAVQRPFHDLGFTREIPPDVLTRAVEDPYALPSGLVCEANLAEIAVLDQVLGPDQRLPGEDAPMDASGLVADVIGGAISLPYSNVIRELTGAAQRDRVLRGAILAGMLRRSFLRGVVLAYDCLPGVEVQPDEVEPGLSAVVDSEGPAEALPPPGE